MRRPYFVHGNVLYSPGRAVALAQFLVPPGVNGQVRDDFAEHVAHLLNHDRHEVIGCAVCNKGFMGNGGLNPDGSGYTQSEYAILKGWRRMKRAWRCPEAACQDPNAPAPHTHDETGTCPHCNPYRCQCDDYHPQRCTAEHAATRTGCLLPRGHVDNHRNLLFAWPDHESAPREKGDA